MRRNPASSRADDDTIRRSVDSARFNPAPTADPRTAAIVGTDSVPIRRNAVYTAPSSL